MTMEKRILTARFGKIDPLSIDDYIKNGGYEALEAAVKMESDTIIDEIETAKLRGRGGAAFPTFIKLKALVGEKEKTRYIVCNADEGEPGNFKDRHLMENDPHQMIEGMIISAYTTKAKKGYIYIRGEYDHSIAVVREALAQAREKGYLGKNILGAGFDFDIEIRSGAGAYVCGEEFALIESIEGKSGRSRPKPPFPTNAGVFMKPTMLNNVETFANIPHILEMGGKAYAKIGTESSKGTKLISLSGNIANRGVFEVPFGVSVKDAIAKLGRGVADGRKLMMVQLSGASGPILPPEKIDVPIDFDHDIGAGAIIVMDERTDVVDILLRHAEFFEHESCGKCTPCREGNLHLVRLLRKVQAGSATADDLRVMENLADVMINVSLCGLGQSAPIPLATALDGFGDQIRDRLAQTETKENA